MTCQAHAKYREINPSNKHIGNTMYNHFLDIILQGKHQDLYNFFIEKFH